MIEHTPGCTERRQVGQHQVLKMIGIQLSIEKGEPLFEDVDIPEGWSTYTFRPMFKSKGGKYICHAMLAGAVPVPINAVTGKRKAGGCAFFYQE
jgi:hypothetical protein